MNVKEQGPGGLLMLFAGGAVLQHLATVRPLIQPALEAGSPAGQRGAWLVAGLFAAVVAFFLLAQLKQQQARNVLGFILGIGVLTALAWFYSYEVRIQAQQIAAPTDTTGTLTDRTLVTTTEQTLRRYRDPRLAADIAAARRYWSGSNPYSGAASRHQVSATPPPLEPIQLAHYEQESVSGPYLRPAGSLLLWVPLAALDPQQTVDPRMVLLGLLIATIMLVGVAFGPRFFFLPMLIVLTLRFYLDTLLEGDPAIVWICLAAIAWVFAPLRILSGLLMGLACALDPQAWFVAPFLIAIGVRESGWGKGMLQLLMVILAFGAVNGYWIAQQPTDWCAAQIAIFQDATPSLPAASVGIGVLEQAKLVEALPHIQAYWLVVGLLLVSMLVLQMVAPAWTYSLGPIFGLLPFWAFVRSDMTLFAGLPLLALAGWASARIFPPEQRLTCTACSVQTAD